jgi:cytochrome c oxidase subunit 2
MAWTVIPVLIVLALFLAAARVIASVQNPPRPAAALAVTVIATSTGGNTNILA